MINIVWLSFGMVLIVHVYIYMMVAYEIWKYIVESG